MAKAAWIQNTFNGGEYSAYLDGRSDIDAYPKGCRILENFLPLVQGPIVKRSGTRFVSEAKDSADNGALVPFLFGTEDAYALEFGDLYMRVYRNSALVTFTPLTIDLGDNLNPARITTIGSHGLATGDRVVITGMEIDGTKIGRLLNNREFRVTVISGTVVSLQDAQTGANIDATTFTDQTADVGTIAKIFELVTPYGHADVHKLTWAQSADVMYLACPGYYPRKLSRLGHTDWTIVKVPFDFPPFLPENEEVAKTVFLDDDPMGGSIKTGKTGSVLTITTVGNTTPVRITSTAHGLLTGQTVWIEGTSISAINDAGYRITRVDANNFDLDGTTAQGAGSGGTAYECRSVVAEFAQVRINTMDGTGPGGKTRITTLSNHGLTTSDQIYITGCEGNHQFNGRLVTVTVNSSTQFDLLAPAENFNGDAYSSAYRRGVITPKAILEAADIFESADVGFELAFSELPAGQYRVWQSGAAGQSAIGNLRYFGNNVYAVVDTRNGGSPAFGGPTAPVHDLPGSQAWDGVDPTATTGLKWEHQHSGKSWCKIARYITEGLVYVFIPSYAKTQRLPVGAVRKIGDSSATMEYEETHRWSKAAFSTPQGFPRTVCFFEDRLIWAATSEKPETLWASRIGDYENHRETTNTEGALQYTLNSETVNEIEWLSPGDRLVCGTSGAEFVGGAAKDDEVMSPTSVRFVRRTTYGSKAAVRPIRIGSALLYVQRKGRKLREFMYDETAALYDANDLNRLADHIGKTSLAQIVFQQEPLRHVWARTESGILAALTYERAEQVVGWHRHPIGGTSVSVESMCVIPHPTEFSDQLWLFVKRTIDGGTHRYIEILEGHWEDGDAIADGFFVDSGLTYSGAATTELTGLYHLRGQTVKVLGEGVVQADKTVSSSGVITGLTSATKFQVGLAYKGKYKAMRIEAGSNDGTAQGKIRRLIGAVFRLFQTGTGLKYGIEATNHTVRMTTNQDPSGAAQTLLTGDTEFLPWPEGYDDDAELYIEHGEPTPCTLIAAMPQFTAQSRM